LSAEARIADALQVSLKFFILFSSILGIVDQSILVVVKLFLSLSNDDIGIFKTVHLDVEENLREVVL
jgi:hypothetical protein